MLKRTFFCVCVFLISSAKFFGQVNLQTGTATFSLPMFNWQDDRSRLHDIIALSYNSGNGLKVNDVASSVGQGWNLVVGGVITRMQVGEPDDQVAYNGNGAESDIRKYPNGYLYANKAPTDGCPDALRKYPIYKHMNQVYTQHNSITEDKQLDYFSFQFNGKAGMFVLNKGEGGDIGLSLGDSKMKITFQRDPSMATGTNQGIRTTIKSFTIQDVDGLIYKFEKHGLTKVLESNYCDPTATHKIIQPKMEGGGIYHQSGFDNPAFVNPFIIGSWYLSEIKDPFTPRKITLTYWDRNINQVAGEDISYNQEGNNAIISHKRSITKTPQINTITYPDGHSVIFNYGDDRIDLAGEKILSSVDIKYTARFISKYLLNTTYLIRNRYGTPVSDYQKKSARLCLKSVQKIGVDLKEDTPPYIFDYFLGSNDDDIVPPPFHYAKDIWGFYNGNYMVDHNNGTPIQLDKSINELTLDELLGVCHLRSGVSGVYLNPKPGLAKNGLLKQIIYPTGGTLAYEYEQNVGKVTAGSVEQPVGGVHVSKTKSTDGGFSNNCDNPLVTQYDYVMNGSGSESSLWGLEMPVNSVVTHAHYKPEHKKYKWFGCGSPFGCCYYKYQYPGILSQNQSVSLSDFQKFMVSAAPVLGIVSIITTVLDVVNLVCYSSGFMAWAAVIIDIVAGLVVVVLTCFNNPEENKTNTTFYSTDLNGVSPLPTQFKRVEVIENPGTRGKTVHEFTSDDDYPIWHLTNPTFSAKQRFAPWAYGLPKMITVIDQNGNYTIQTKNTYNFNTYYGSMHCWPPRDRYDRTKLLKQPLGNASCKCVVKKSESQRNIAWADPNVYDNPESYQVESNSDLVVDIYEMYTGRTELNKVEERVYEPNSTTEYLETVTEYVYNDDNYEVSLIRTKSSEDGYSYDYRQKNIFYTIDYKKVHGYCYDLVAIETDNPEITALVDANIIGQVVESNEMVVKSGSVLYTSDKATVFATLTTGEIKPSKVLEGRFAKPESKDMIWDRDWAMNSFVIRAPLFNPSNPDLTYYKTTQTFTYDALGYLVGVKDEANRQVSNIYDYGNKFIVASIINADPVLDKFAYSSFETTELGNWQLTGGLAAYSVPGLTGARSLRLNSRTLSSPLVTTKPHLLSFWGSAVATVSTGATLVKTGPTINGFTYYEYEISQGTSSINISGSLNIDEARLYPKSARVRTVTYDLLLGKTSECDENNRVTYYEYDLLGRLLYIKDDKMNIIKMYEYNNVSASKQQGCPGIYYNQQIVETFVRDNCGPDFVGSKYIYTVPAMKYSSVISQADADAQADNELLTLGQSTANINGTCIPIYKNQTQFQVFISQTCDAGYAGGNVTYTVPADRYVSTVNVGDANLMALAEIAANGQAYANDPANRVCVVDNNPDWEWDNTSSYCQSIGGNLPPHLFVRETDVNPNSSTYNQTRWVDVGPDAACPANTYYSSAANGVFQRNNCGSGYTGSFVTYNVEPGIYSSTASQAAADQQAADDISTNGQNYANAEGTCSVSCSFSATSGFGIATSSISVTGSTVSFYLVFYSSSGTTNWTNTNTVANINGGCNPSGNRILTMSASGRTWQVIISSYGTVNVKLISGTPPTGSSPVSLTGGSFNL